MADKLASLVVDLQVQSAELRKGLDEANKKLDDFGKKAKSAGLDLSKAFSGIERVIGKAKEAAAAIGQIGLAMGAAIAGAAAVVASGNLDRAVAAQVNRSKILFQTFATEVARAFEPMMRAANGALRDVIAVMQHMDPLLKQQIVNWVKLGVEVGGAFLIFSKVATVLKSLVAIADVATSAVKVLFAPELLVTLGAIAIGVMGIVLAVGALKQAIDEIDWGPLTGTGGRLADTLKSLTPGNIASLGGAALSSVFPGVSYLLGRHNAPVANEPDFHGRSMDLAGNVVGEAGSRTGSGSIVPGITDAVAKSWDVGVKTLIEPLKEQMGGFLKMFEGIFGAAAKAKNQPITLAERQAETVVGNPVGAEEARLAHELEMFIPPPQLREGQDVKDPAFLQAIHEWGRSIENDGRAATDLALEGMRKFGLEISNQVPAVGGVMQRYNDTLRDHAIKLSQAAEAFVKSFPQRIAAASGKVGSLVGTFMQTTEETDNPLLGAAAAGLQLLTSSKQFQKIVATLDAVFQTLSDTVGSVLESIMPVVDLLADVADVVGILLAPVLQLLAPVFQMLAGGLRAIFLTVLSVVKFIGDAVNAVAGLFGGKLDTAPLDEAMRKLIGATADSTTATTEATDATEKMADAADAATEALTNVPTGFKVNLARWRAIDTSGGGGRAGGAGVPGGGGVNVDVSLDGQVIAGRIQTRLERTHGRNAGTSNFDLSPRYAGG